MLPEVHLELTPCMRFAHYLELVWNLLAEWGRNSTWCSSQDYLLDQAHCYLALIRDLRTWWNPEGTWGLSDLYQLNQVQKIPDEMPCLPPRFWGGVLPDVIGRLQTQLGSELPFGHPELYILTEPGTTSNSSGIYGLDKGKMLPGLMQRLRAG